MMIIASNGVDKVSQVGASATNQFGTWGIAIAVLGCVLAGITMIFNAEKGKKLLDFFDKTCYSISETNKRQDVRRDKHPTSLCG